MEGDRVCGNCSHWQPNDRKSGNTVKDWIEAHARGSCYKDCPVWVWPAIENVAAEIACAADDKQALECDCFSSRYFVSSDMTASADG